MSSAPNRWPSGLADAALPVGRRDVIFGGALVLREVMARFAFDECIVSEADILDGLIMSLRLHADGPADAERARPEATARPVR